MGIREFRHILEGACAMAPGWNVEKIMVGNPVYSNAVPVWIQYFEPADLCRVVVDLGELDGEIPAAVWRTMLESNCTSTSSFLPFLGISPADGHAVLVMHLSIETFRRHSLETGFSQFLDEKLEPVVTSWRKGLDDISNFSHAGGEMLGSRFA